MKPASPTLLALLASRQFFSADLYQFSLIGAGTLNYCSGDQDIVWNSITWSAGKSTATRRSESWRLLFGQPIRGYNNRTQNGCRRQDTGCRRRMGRY
jgi:hypothetical protein